MNCEGSRQKNKAVGYKKWVKQIKRGENKEAKLLVKNTNMV